VAFVVASLWHSSWHRRGIRRGIIASSPRNTYSLSLNAHTPPYPTFNRRVHAFTRPIRTSTTSLIRIPTHSRSRSRTTYRPFGHPRKPAPDGGGITQEGVGCVSNGRYRLQLQPLLASTTPFSKGYSFDLESGVG
jgi:hypothetical protein